LLLEIHVTEVRSELETPRLGNEDCDHHVPFQLRARAVVTELKPRNTDERLE